MKYTPESCTVLADLAAREKHWREKRSEETKKEKVETSTPWGKCQKNKTSKGELCPPFLDNLLSLIEQLHTVSLF